MAPADGAGEVVVTGMGVVSSIACDLAGYAAALRAGRCGMRAVAPAAGAPGPVRVQAPVQGFAWRAALARHADTLAPCWRRAQPILRMAPRSLQMSASAAMQAVEAAALLPLAHGAGARVGVVVGGSNLHLAAAYDAARRLDGHAGALNPRHAVYMFDSAQVGALTEIFGFHGPSLTVGAASASGNAALFQAWTWLRAGVLDACLVVGAGSDLSALELEAFDAIGALGGAAMAAQPGRACRPFDRAHDGFVWGEGSAALVLESAAHACARGAAVRGRVLGASLQMDGNHLTDSSVAGEVRAMRAALAAAGLPAAAIAYVNAHGTATALGDRTECAALREVFGARAGAVAVNATKSLTGHCLGASGVLEAVACLLQMDGGFLHPTNNLDDPIDAVLDFVAGAARAGAPALAMSNGFGFGGVNSTIILGKETT